MEHVVLAVLLSAPVSHGMRGHMSARLMSVVAAGFGGCIMKLSGVKKLRSRKLTGC